MSLSFQNKLIFPAPENSYTVFTSQNQVIYLPKDIMKRATKRAKLGYPTNKKLYHMIQMQKNEEIEKLRMQRKREKIAKKKLKESLNPVKKVKKVRVSLLDSFSSSSEEDSDETSEEEEKGGEKGDENVEFTEVETNSPVNQQETIEDLESKIKKAEKIRDPGDLIERRKKSKKKS
jgi:hypothetical protein